MLRKGFYALPIRQGLQKIGEDGDAAEEGEEGSRSNEAHARKRKIQGALIRAAVRAAKRTRERLAAWPDEAPAAEHLKSLRALLTADLGWDLDAGEARAVRGALEEFEREVPARFRLERDEMRLLVEDLLAAEGGSPIGGQGGGVQVLSVTEARARTFDHLFLMGLNRDVFPRGIREDPLLPDDLRRILQRVLPDVPIKRAGFDEERYLFAQLLSAAPAVTLSWQTADDDGKPLPASPLVERLRERLDVEKAPPLWSLPKSGPLPGPRTAAEHAVMAGLHAPRRWWGRVMKMAIQESRAELAVLRARQAVPLPVFDLSPERLATGRLAVVEEMDPDLRLPDGRTVRARLGPYFGFIGKIPSGGEGEPRLRDLYVTQLENLAACPWQLFLLRLLRIEPTPDPLGALPGVTPCCSATSSMARSTGSPVRPGARWGAAASASSIRWRSPGRRIARSSGCSSRRPTGCSARRGSSSPASAAPWPSWPGRCWRRRGTWTGPAAPCLFWRPRSRASWTSATPRAPSARFSSRPTAWTRTPAAS